MSPIKDDCKNYKSNKDDVDFITFINTRFEDYGKRINTKFEDFEKLVNTRFTENEKLDEVKAEGLDTALQLAKDHVAIKMEELNNLRKEVTEGRIVFFTKEMHEIYAKQLDLWKSQMEERHRIIDFNIAKWNGRVIVISTITGVLAALGGALLTIITHLIFGGSVIP